MICLDSSNSFLDVCTCQSLLNCILLNVQLITHQSYLNNAENEKLLVGITKSQGRTMRRKNNGEKPGARARQKPEVR